MKSALDFVYMLIPDRLDVALDATLGQGKDALVLAKRSNKLYGFEIQEEAFLRAKKLLAPYNTQLFNTCHSRIGDLVKEDLDLIIFNLGYLPRGDKRITTQASTTRTALLEGFRLLKPGGRILLVAYGHTQGREEILMLENLEIQQEEGDIFRLVHHNGRNNPPEAWIILKK